MSSPQPFSLPLLKSEIVAKNTHAFHFDRTKISTNGGPASGWDFKPGQYLRMILPHDNPDDRGTSRFFSIASSPTHLEEIVVITKEGPSTFKQKLLSLPPGTVVDFRAPFGSFILEEDSSVPQVLLTGGIGITPFVSMVQYATDKQLPLSIMLFASFSTPEEIVLKQMFEECQQKNPHFKYVVTVTHPEESQTPWSGQTGRINKELLEKYLPDLRNCTYYIVGPESMNRALSELLSSLEVSEDNIRLEDFTGY